MAGRVLRMVAALLAAVVLGMVAAGPALAAPDKYYVVGPPVNGQRESLYDIAWKTLGDGNRYREIAGLNAGRPQPDGGSVGNSMEVHPGWILLLPPDADGPGVQVGPPPAVVPSHSPSPVPAPAPVADPAGPPLGAVVLAVVFFMGTALALVVLLRALWVRGSGRPADATSGPPPGPSASPPPSPPGLPAGHAAGLPARFPAGFPALADERLPAGSPMVADERLTYPFVLAGVDQRVPLAASSSLDGSSAPYTVQETVRIEPGRRPAAGTEDGAGPLLEFPRPSSVDAADVASPPSDVDVGDDEPARAARQAARPWNGHWTGPAGKGVRPVVDVDLPPLA